VFEEAAGLPAMIFTFNPENSVRQSFIQKNGGDDRIAGRPSVFVEVVCDPAELERRMDTPERRNHKKLVSLELFRELQTQGVFDSPKIAQAALVH